MSTPIIPSHLRPHVAPQHYEDYTPTDHAVWRYVMRLNLNTLQDTAHPAYLEGLAASGISPERIPDVREMTISKDMVYYRLRPTSGRSITFSTLQHRIFCTKQRGMHRS